MKNAQKKSSRKKEFKTSNNLLFEAAPWPFNLDTKYPWLLFRIGTCQGAWRSKKGAYEILSVVNNEPHNGHFKDVLEWFEHSCRRDGKKLCILEVWNQPLKKHLIEKQGFIAIDGDNLEKTFV